MAHPLDFFATDLQKAPRVWIAFSGGMDSTLLLNLMAEFIEPSNLVALHIHHGLHKEADQWQDLCAMEAARLGVEFQAAKVRVDPEANVEANARDKRYQVFAEKLGKGELLLTAHHANDQAETLLFRMMRGAGLRGLSGMPEKRPLGLGYLLRPLLSFSKTQLQEMASQRELVWVEDTSNQDIQYSRNFIRQQIVPVLEQRWPSAIKKINQTAVALKEAEALLGRYGRELASQCGLRSEAFGTSLDLHAFKTLDMAQRQLVLRYLLAARGEHPDSRRLDELLRQLEEVNTESHIRDCYRSVELQVFQHRLYLLEPLTSIEANKIYAWDGRSDLIIPGIGCLSASAELAKQGPFQVGFRQGGERCQPLNRAHSQNLKKLFQDLDVPPWLRERTPLVYQNDELVAVAGLFSCSKNLPLPVFKWQGQLAP